MTLKLAARSVSLEPPEIHEKLVFDKLSSLKKSRSQQALRGDRAARATIILKLKQDLRLTLVGSTLLASSQEPQESAAPLSKDDWKTLDALLKTRKNSIKPPLVPSSKAFI